ncbi:MAG: DNA-binding protein [Planctomycetaceae bacterium]|nr:DNA-binding protein [Planctomycetaceae bacterium]
MAKASAKPPTKTEIISNIAQATDLSKKEVAAVFTALAAEIKRAIGKRGGPGQFTVPGLCKITVVRKPATRERKGINPFTGEATVFAAKPARNVIKIRALKALKDMV